MSNLPKKLENCPLVDAIIEIRFELSPNMNKNLVFPLIYAQNKEIFTGQATSLPISFVPEPVREQDVNYKYKPLYRVDGKESILQVGTDVICISSKMPYIGWDRLLELSIKVINSARDLGIIGKVTRLGHRYVNFFEGDILDNLSIKINSNQQYVPIGKSYRLDLKYNDYINVLQVSNMGRFQPIGSSERKGSIIDIDTSRNYDFDSFLENMKEELNNAHESEKTLFYSLLDNKLLTSLAPVYGK